MNILSNFIEKLKNRIELNKKDIKLCALLSDVFCDDKLKIDEDINNIYKKNRKRSWDKNG